MCEDNRVENEGMEDVIGVIGGRDEGLVDQVIMREYKSTLRDVSMHPVKVEGSDSSHVWTVRIVRFILRMGGRLRKAGHSHSVVYEVLNIVYGIPYIEIDDVVDKCMEEVDSLIVYHMDRQSKSTSSSKIVDVERKRRLLHTLDRHIRTTREEATVDRYLSAIDSRIQEDGSIPAMVNIHDTDSMADVYSWYDRGTLM